MVSHSTPRVETIVPMETLPSFSDGVLYEIKVKEAVQIGPEQWARPSSPKIVVDGEKAREIEDYIIWARQL